MYIFPLDNHLLIDFLKDKYYENYNRSNHLMDNFNLKEDAYLLNIDFYRIYKDKNQKNLSYLHLMLKLK